jgi:predicted transcriptional regulator
MPYLFSIHPRYTRAILSGEKTVELRRRFGRGCLGGDLMLIYETAPTMAITGFCLIDEARELTVSKLWPVAKSKGCIAQADFDSYFEGRRTGVALELSSATTLAAPISMNEMFATCGLRPPQSYRVLSSETVLKLIGLSAGQVHPRYEHLDPRRGSEADAANVRGIAA